MPMANIHLCADVEPIAEVIARLEKERRNGKIVRWIAGKNRSKYYL
jgi:hypothetical protein